MNDEQVRLIHKEYRANSSDSIVSEVKLHLEEGVQTEFPEAKPKKEKSSNACFYFMIAACLGILLIPIIVYLEKKSRN
jgi:hypothetical protein